MELSDIQASARDVIDHKQITNKSISPKSGDSQSYGSRNEMASANGEAAHLSTPNDTSRNFNISTLKTKLQTQSKEWYVSMDQLGQRTSVFAFGCVLLQGISLLLHIIAFATPGWGRTYIDNTGDKTEITAGLWEVCQAHGCSYLKSISLAGIYRAAQAFAVFALLAQMFAGLFLMIYTFCVQLLRDKRMAVFFIILSNVSVVFLVITFSTFAAGWLQLGLGVQTEVSGDRALSHSFALDIVSACVQMFAGLLILFDFRFEKFILTPNYDTPLIT